MSDITPERIAAARMKAKECVWEHGASTIPGDFLVALDRLIAFERAEAVWGGRDHEMCEQPDSCEFVVALTGTIVAIEEARP